MNNHFVMNDLHFILRMIKRNPLMFVTNVIGLGVALTTMMLTITYIRYELSYDTHFKTKDRVVRLYSRVTNSSTTNVYGISLRQAYRQIPERVPEIESAVQLYGGWPTSVQNKENRIGKIRVFYADNEIFKVFGLKLRSGDDRTALVGVNSVVITTPLAEKLFNSTNCVGQTIEADGEHLMITGVMDELPKNSHMSFDLLVSLSTLEPDRFGGLEFQTYFLLKEHIDQKAAKA